MAVVTSTSVEREPREAFRPRLADVVVVVVLVGLMVFEASVRVRQPNQHPYDVASYLLIAGMTLPYLGHRRFPMSMLALALGAVLWYSFLHYTAFPGLNAFTLLFGIALHSDRRRSLVAFVATLTVMMVALGAQPPNITNLSDWISNALCTAVAWLLGDNWRLRRGRWASLQERNAMLEHDREEQARKAVVAERLRIARELHDAVAHSMSVIAVQAGMGHHVIDTQPGEAKLALGAIETTSRAALVEMRRLLGVLRQEGETTAALVPAPSLNDLPTLISQAHGAGVDVELTVSGEPRELPSSMGLSAYRIVQEALTNTIRYGGPQAQVLLKYAADELRIQITDGGPVTPETPRPSAGAGAGQGLIGMRERVAIFGGELAAGPRPGGGFTVSATLPLSTVTS